MLCRWKWAATGLITFAAVGVAHAQDLASVWKGKVVTVVVGTSAGGGYDLYARLFSRHLGKHLPGNPSVVVTNMPGAGSHLMAGYVANVAPKDGLWIGAPFSTQPLGPILEDASQLRYDPRKLAYLGSADEDAFMCIMRKGAPIKTFADAFKTPAVTAGTAETGSTGYLPVLLNNVLGTKFKPVVGYPGTREMTMAIEKGEVDGMCGMNWSSINTQYKDMYGSGRIFILVQERMSGYAALDKLGIPKVGDYAKTEEQRSILSIIYSQQVFSRPYFVAGDVAPERVAALRSAFMETWKDPELLAEADKMGLEIGPISGREMQDMLAKIYANTPAILAKVKEAIKFPH